MDQQRATPLAQCNFNPQWRLTHEHTNMKAHPSKTRIPALAFFGLLIPFAIQAASTVTFDNKSGMPALVKLVGPTASSVSVENSKKESAAVLPGHYFIKIRYGTPSAYSYSKGDEFDVTETATTASAITITLHRVVSGNYDSKPISETEFGSDTPNSKQEPPSASIVGSNAKYSQSNATSNSAQNATSKTDRSVARAKEGSPITFDFVRATLNGTDLFGMTLEDVTAMLGDSTFEETPHEEVTGAARKKLGAFHAYARHGMFLTFAHPDQDKSQRCVTVNIFLVPPPLYHGEKIHVFSGRLNQDLDGTWTIDKLVAHFPWFASQYSIAKFLETCRESAPSSNKVNTLCVPLPTHIVLINHIGNILCGLNVAKHNAQQMKTTPTISEPSEASSLTGPSTTTAGEAALTQWKKIALDKDVEWVGANNAYFGVKQLSPKDFPKGDFFTIDIKNNPWVTKEPLTPDTVTQKYGTPCLILKSQDGCIVYDYGPVQFSLQETSKSFTQLTVLKMLFERGVTRSAQDLPK